MGRLDKKLIWLLSVKKTLAYSSILQQLCRQYHCKRTPRRNLASRTHKIGLQAYSPARRKRIATVFWNIWVSVVYNWSHIRLVVQCWYLFALRTVYWWCLGVALQRWLLVCAFYIAYLFSNICNCYPSYNFLIIYLNVKSFEWCMLDMISFFTTQHSSVLFIYNIQDSVVASAKCLLTGLNTVTWPTHTIIKKLHHYLEISSHEIFILSPTSSRIRFCTDHRLQKHPSLCFALHRG